MHTGTKVKTPLGTGVIVGKDLPDSRAWRWIVELDDGKRLCFWDREVTPCTQEG
jgi:hypothetical protein